MFRTTAHAFLSDSFPVFARTLLGLSIVASLGACSSGGGDSSGNVQSLQSTGAVSSFEADPLNVVSNNTNCEMSDLDQELLDALNAARAQSRSCGADFYPAVGAVTWNCQLESAALAHSKDMGDNNFFSHTGSDGLRIGHRATTAGYDWSMVGENIAAGFYTVGSVMQGWLDSPSHCSAIMNPYYQEGATVAYIAEDADYDVYWTMVLGVPSN
jgi:uncharacterized protein YkwD